MFKNTLITLMMGAACMSHAMELAQKHLTDVQKQRQSGMADNLQVLEAEIAYYGAEAFLNADSMTDEEAQKSREKLLELLKQAYTLTQARYQMGLCSYKKVFEAQYALRCEEAALLNSGEAIKELDKIHREYGSVIEKQVQAGMVDAVERLECERALLMKQFFNNTLYADQAAALQKKIEQNFDEAKKLIQLRYKAGLLPYDEMENINYREMQFQMQREMWNMAIRSSTTEEQWEKIRRKHTDLMKQAYEAVADSPNVSPYTKLQRRLDYVLAKKSIERR